MKDKETRQNLKNEYISNWLQYCKDNPDMPIRAQFTNKRDYREAKNEWNDSKTNYSAYLWKRYYYYKSKGNHEMMDLYMNCHSKEMSKPTPT